MAAKQNTAPNKAQTQQETQQPAAPKVRAVQVKKITIAGIHGQIDVKKVLNSEEPLSVMRVYGRAVARKQVPTPFGESTCLLGSFEAVGTETGQIQQASQLYLPEVALIPILSAMIDGDNIRPVTFAIELFVRQSVNKKAGGSVYEYEFQPLIPPEDTDPMEMLRAKLSEVAPALPAPVRTAEAIKRGPGRPPKSN